MNDDSDFIKAFFGHEPIDLRERANAVLNANNQIFTDVQRRDLDMVLRAIARGLHTDEQWRGAAWFAAEIGAMLHDALNHTDTEEMRVCLTNFMLAVTATFCAQPEVMQALLPRNDDIDGIEL